MSPLNRREFLATSSSLAAAAAVSGTAAPAGAASPSEFDGAIIGHGDFRYRVDTQWCQADRDVHPVGNCHEMEQASDGRLFMITDHPQNNLLVFDTEGRVVNAWTHNSRGGHGLTINQEEGGEFLYLTFTDGKVLKTDLDGKVVLTLPHPAKCGAYHGRQKYSPTETAVSDNGDIYVADGYGSQHILQFDKEGKFIRKFGGISTRPIPPGRFLQAHGVAIDRRGDEPLLVCTERVRNEFNWYTLDGKHVRCVYLPGAYVSRPVLHGDQLYSGVCFGAKPNDHRMYVDRGFVTILDKDDKVVSNPGGHEPEYRDGALQMMLQDQPVFRNCHDVCLDTNDDMYVCQWASGKVYPYKLHRVS